MMVKKISISVSKCTRLCMYPNVLFCPHGNIFNLLSQKNKLYILDFEQKDLSTKMLKTTSDIKVS